MDSGYYAACTALMSRTQALDTIANNLANASTVGFRSEHNVFSSVLASASGASGTVLNRAMNSFGIMSGTSMDQTQGTLQKTGNDLDVAIQGSGYLVVQTANGPVYTRNGSLQVSGKGQLVTSEGDAVMGDKGEISIVPGKVSISTDGTISINGAVAGKLKVVDFPAGTRLTSVGSTYYSVPSDVVPQASTSDVRQGALEGSNVNPIAGMVDLVTAQRTTEMMQRALSMFNSEIDKTASQDLPKVS
ncbi:MAG: flagellar basal-body rod protein FlgF [Terracidiphilus sp.]|jgi:flagellar basal-body rod protein FlgF/flagellar basal-body rod protein FlgG